MTIFQIFASEQQINVAMSTPNDQYQNGLSECGIGFVQDAAYCYTIQMKMLSVFWILELYVRDDILHPKLYISNFDSDIRTPWEVCWSQS